LRELPPGMQQRDPPVANFGAPVQSSRRNRPVRDGNVITGGGISAGLDLAWSAMAEIFGQQTG